ncbi:MAG TPA: M20/M25/M40 family metallo-hydrolase, partial [Anaerolineae bacterium]|nr:M20/M25/M40 family metallo-hydrolase [Anaerolineae bacterium]
GGSTGLLLSAVLNPLLHDAALKAMPDRSFADGLHAILHNTLSPNQLNAGYKVNVIPSEAEALLDGRMLPGFEVESFLAEVRSRLGEGFDLSIIHTSPPLEVSTDTPLFRLIEQHVARSDPGAIAVPYMLTGATDAKLFAQLGTKCYGYAPMRLRPDEAHDGLIHGHDERISITALGFGVRGLYETVLDFCTSR